MRIPPHLFVVCVCLAAFVALPAAHSKPTKASAPARHRTLGISGVASSAQHCLGSTSTSTGIHQIGAVPNGSQVTVTFVSDFDPVASVVFAQQGSLAPDGGARFSYMFDDDSGGNLEPEIRAVATFDGMAVLYVSRFAGGNEGGCYFYKVEVQTP
jgi:hypothetical protein